MCTFCEWVVTHYFFTLSPSMILTFATKSFLVVIFVIVSFVAWRKKKSNLSWPSPSKTLPLLFLFIIVVAAKATTNVHDNYFYYHCSLWQLKHSVKISNTSHTHIFLLIFSLNFSLLSKISLYNYSLIILYTILFPILSLFTLIGFIHTRSKYIYT